MIPQEQSQPTLPVLPIVLSGSVGGGKARPFGVLAGFVVSFTVFTLTLSAIVQALGIPWTRCGSWPWCSSSSSAS